MSVTAASVQRIAQQRSTIPDSIIKSPACVDLSRSFTKGFGTYLE